jgi:DNA sulfur modification protein DndD
MIIFDKIVLHNFRRYTDAEFEFKQSENENLNIILARNGVGKSTLFDAFTWCLFDVEDHLKIDPQYAKEAEGILNSTIQSKLKAHSRTNLSVTIFLTDTSDDKKYKIEKVVAYSAETNELGGLRLLESKPEKTIYEKTKQARDWTKYPRSPNSLIEQLIPRELRQFFFFDGEQLREHFKGDSNQYLKDKIEQVSRLSVLNDILCGLKAYNETLEQKIRKLAKDHELDQLELDFRQENDQLERRLTEKAGHEKKRSESSRVRAALIEQINVFGKANSDISLLNREYQDAEHKLQDLRSQLADRTRAYERIVLDEAPLVLLKNKLQTSINIINTAIKNKDAPVPITEDYLTGLIKDGECMCGTSLRKNPKCKDRLQSVLETVRGQRAINYGEGQFHLDRFLAEAKSFNEKIAPIAIEVKRLKSEVGKTIEHLDKLTKIRENSENKKLGNLQMELSLREDEIRNIDQTIGGLTKDIEYLTWSVTEKKNKYELKKKKAGAAQELVSKQEKVMSVIKSLEAFKGFILERNRTLLTKKTEDYLRKLLAQKAESEISEVEINDDYELRLVSKINPLNNLRHTLSAGETQIFVLSFAAALREVTGFNAPLLIDTPLGKIDDENRTLVVNALPQIFKKTQLIFLVTSSEYSKDVANAFDKNFPKSKKYAIEKAGQSSETNRLKVIT